MSKVTRDTRLPFTRVRLLLILAAIRTARVVATINRFFIIVHLREAHVVDGIGGSLHHLEHYTVVNMIEQVLGVPERFAADRAISSGIPGVVHTSLDGGNWPLMTLVWWHQLRSVDRDKVAFEHINTSEALFFWCPSVWTKVAHHDALIVNQCVAILIVFASEPLGVVLARYNRALFWTLSGVRHGVSS